MAVDGGGVAGHDGACPGDAAECGPGVVVGVAVCVGDKAAGVGVGVVDEAGCAECWWEDDGAVFVFGDAGGEAFPVDGGPEGELSGVFDGGDSGGGVFGAEVAAVLGGEVYFEGCGVCGGGFFGKSDGGLEVDEELEFGLAGLVEGEDGGFVEVEAVEEAADIGFSGQAGGVGDADCEGWGDGLWGGRIVGVGGEVLGGWHWVVR